MKLSILILFLISTPALAKIHIEPYLGYGWTLINKSQFSKKTDTIENIKTSYQYFKEGKKYKTLSGGVRLGYRSLGLALGADMSIADWSSNTSDHLQPMTLGVFASYNLPILFRVYGVLIPKAIMKSATLDCNQSRGLKVGLSYLSIPFLSVNFEYQSLLINGVSSECQNIAHTGTVFLNFMF